jgi:hypothetical protein
VLRLLLLNNLPSIFAFIIELQQLINGFLLLILLFLHVHIIVAIFVVIVVVILQEPFTCLYHSGIIEPFDGLGVVGRP